MYSPSSYSYGGAVTKESALTDQKLEFFLGATISALILCFLNFFTFFLGLYNLFGVPTNSIAVVRIVYLLEPFFFVSGPSANSFLLVDNFLLSLRVSCVLLVLSI